MRFFSGSIRSGSAWTLVFFLLSFARTIILTPLMLTYWGKDVFCFWALMLSARALICFLPDSFIRYVINEYNIRFHRDPDQAALIMRAGGRFLALFSAGLCVLLLLLFVCSPPLVAFLFDVPVSTVSEYGLGGSLAVYILSALVQVQQRLYSGAKEPLGKLWQNLLMESVLLAAELLLLGLLISKGFDFSTCIWADSLLVIVAALTYMLLLRPYISRVRTHADLYTTGARLFFNAGRLYAANFFEKAASDGIVLLMSLFRFDKTAIAVFATVRTLVNAPLLGANLLLNAWGPELQRRYSLKDHDGLQRLLRTVRAGAGVLLATTIVCCYPLYEPVFLYWTKGQLPYSGLFMALMLVSGVFNLAGLGYNFILKGVNAMQRFLYVVLLKTILIIGLLVLAAPVQISIAWVCCATEIIPCVLLLPRFSSRQLQENGMAGSYGKELSYLLPYLLAALVLIWFGFFGFSPILLFVYLLLVLLCTWARFRVVPVD